MGLWLKGFFNMYVFYFHENTILIVCLTERMYLKVNIQQSLMNLNKNNLSVFTLELGWFSSKSSYFRSMKGEPDAWFLVGKPRKSRTWHDLCSCHGLSVTLSSVFSLNRKIFFKVESQILRDFLACLLFFCLQVIYRALSPWHSVDPYGPAAQDQLMITNLRVRLLQRQPCPCQAKHPGVAVLPTDHYAIYDFIVKGSCLCNGHADHCVPASGYKLSQQRTNNMVRDFETQLAGGLVFHQGNAQKRCCVTLKSVNGFI